MHPELSKKTADFEHWATEAARVHRDLLDEALSKFEMYGFTPFNDFFLEVIADFKTHLVKAVFPNNPDAQIWAFHEVDSWYFAKVRDVGTDFMLLAVIRDKGVDYLAQKMDDFTPASAPTVPGLV